MKWPLFENKIRKTLSNHQTTVDADAIWAAIEPQVDVINRRRKRRGIAWFMFMGLLLGGGALAYFYPLSNDGSPAKDLSTASVEQPAENSKPASPEKDLSNADLTKVKEAPISKNGALSNAGEMAIHKAELPIKRQTNKTIKKDAAPPTRNYSETVAYNKLASLKKADNLPILVDENNPASINENLTSLAINDATIAPINEVQLDKKSPDYIPTLTIDKFSNRSNIGIASKLSILPKPELKPLPAAASPSRHRNPFEFSADLQGSIGFVERELAARDSSYDNLHDLREKTERELESFQLGLRFSLHHESGFGLSSGFNYTQINEQFRYFTSVISVDTVEGIKYLVVNLDNDTIPIYGDVPLGHKTNFRKLYYNKYRMLDIPLLASYQFRTDHFNLRAQAGVFVNLRLATEGHVLQSASLDTDISEDGIFKSNIGLSYYLGFSAGYLINENLEAFISPFMRRFPKSFTESSYGLSQRYKLYGVNIGLGYHF